MLSEDVKNRLLNWKFEQARAQLMREPYGSPGHSNPTDEEQETVIALVQTFGNSGWFEGSLADVVRAAVWFLGVDE